MASMVELEKYGFFNGIYAIEQGNWADFWRGFVPSFVCSNQGGNLADMGGELEVYAVDGGEGMKVRVRSGQAVVNGHHVWSTAEKSIDITTADPANPRIDTVILRVVYGNEGESKVYVTVKDGTPDASPVAPALSETTGTVYEYALADVYVTAGVSTILPDKITDRRYLHAVTSQSIVPFSGNSVSPQNELEYRDLSAHTSMEIILPEHPTETYISSVVFASDGSTFSGVTVKKGGTTISGTTNLHLKGDTLNLKGRVYTLVFWWDGAKYWVASAGAI